MRKLTRRELFRPHIDYGIEWGLSCEETWNGFGEGGSPGWRVWKDEWEVALGHKKRRRVGVLPPSPPPNGSKDLPGQTFFVEAV